MRPVARRRAGDTTYTARRCAARRVAANVGSGVASGWDMGSVPRGRSPAYLRLRLVAGHHDVLARGAERPGGALVHRRAQGDQVGPQVLPAAVGRQELA